MPADTIERDAMTAQRCFGRIFAGIVTYGLASVASRPWHRSWGASWEEAGKPLPGDGLVPDAAHQTTRAIDIAAPVSEVWPWLVQMGQGRAGFYTYEWVENLLGAKIHNLDRLDPSLQDLAVGDRVCLTPEVYLGRIPGQFYRVAEIRDEEALVMLQKLPTGGSTSWAFALTSTGPRTCRLIVRGRSSRPSRLGQRVLRQLELLALEPGYFVMERGVLRGIRRRAEAKP